MIAPLPKVNIGEAEAVVAFIGPIAIILRAVFAGTGYRHFRKLTGAIAKSHRII